MLALVPTIIGVLTVYALVADPDQVRAQLGSLTRIMPEQAREVVVRQVRSATELNSRGLTLGLVVSVLAVLWSTSNAMRWLIAGLNVAYGERETRGFLRLRATALLFAVGMLVVVAAGLGMVGLVPLVLDLVGASGATRVVVNLVRWLGGFLLLGLALATLYRFGPDRGSARRRWISLGSLVAVLLWLAASAGFSLYLSHFPSQQTYGALTGFAVLLLWFYLFAFAVLLGAEVDAELGHR